MAKPVIQDRVAQLAIDLATEVGAADEADVDFHAVKT
jgi:hypothetical protein